MMRVLVTRPIEDARETARQLSSRGFDPVIFPVMRIRFLESRLGSIDAYRALIFSSGNGVRAFVRQSRRRDVKVFAVGPATGTIAAEAGFRDVDVAPGSIDKLVDRIVATTGKGSHLLHAAGRDVAHDLAARRLSHDIRVTRKVLYEAVPEQYGKSEIVQPLSDPQLGAVLLFSPRSARLFAGLVSHAEMSESCRRLTAVCLSSEVAKALAPLDFAEVRVARAANQTALLGLLDSG